MNWKFWTWPAQIRELDRSRIETAKYTGEVHLRQIQAMQSTIDQLRVRAQSAESDLLKEVKITKGYEREVSVLKGLISALKLPTIPAFAPAWTTADEAQLTAFLQSETGDKLSVTLEMMEQETNRSATAQKDRHELHAGKAQGFRHAVLTIKRLCGTPQPKPEANSSDSPPNPEEIAEQFRA